MKLTQYLIIFTIIMNSNVYSKNIKNEKQIKFDVKNLNGFDKDKKVESYEGSFQVPENRQKKDSRLIPIKYVRFPSTSKNPGPPIVYLSGGPGGSGIDTAKYTGRFPLFMALREFGDVIALDQRGTGASNIVPRCQSNQIIARNKVVNDDEYIKQHQDALHECLNFWKSEGTDISGYTTIENVKDLEDLRNHLGAKKITLWGISYGSHMALAALKIMDDKIDKVIIASAEGLDQTVKYPARTDDYFARLQIAIDTQSQSKAMFPDIISLIKRVHTKIETSPLKLSIQLKNETIFDYLLQRRELQEFASGSISDPGRAKKLLQLYLAIDNKMYDPIIALLQRYYQPEGTISYSAMSIAMDLASGMSIERRALIKKQSETSLLKAYLNFSYHLTDVLPSIDLGEEFRNAPKSSVPTLLLSGTLDGRTYIESQLEAVSGLENLTKITIKNAGHNLFMSSPLVTESILKFMSDKKIKDHEIEIDLPKFWEF